MREIKFRAWDIKEQIWLDPKHFYITGEGEAFTCQQGAHNISCHYELMGTERYKVNRFTSLKDKNGKGKNEVYENDIVICSCKLSPDIFYKGVIKYSAPQFYLAIFWEEIDGVQASYPVGENRRSLIGGTWSIDKILGNVHQNPKLMEQGNG